MVTTLHITNHYQNRELEEPDLKGSTIHSARSAFKPEDKIFRKRLSADKICHFLCQCKMSELALYSCVSQQTFYINSEENENPRQKQLRHPHANCRGFRLAARLDISLLRVSREAWSEGSKALYENTTFSFDRPSILARFLASITVAQRAQIQHLRLRMNLPGYASRTWAGDWTGYDGGDSRNAEPPPVMTAWARALNELVVSKLSNLRSLNLSVCLDVRMISPPGAHFYIASIRRYYYRASDSMSCSP